MYKVENFMEQVVRDKVDNVIKELKVCNCIKCKSDIIAMALNKLPPKYVVTTTGNIYTRIAAMEKQFEVNVISALVQAAVTVKDNPQHDEITESV